MEIKRTEYHQMLCHFIYDIPEEDIIKEFGALDTFLAEMYDVNDEFYEFVNQYDYKRVDDVLTGTLAMGTDLHKDYDVKWDLNEED